MRARALKKGSPSGAACCRSLLSVRRLLLDVRLGSEVHGDVLVLRDHHHPQYALVAHLRLPPEQALARISWFRTRSGFCAPRAAFAQGFAGVGIRPGTPLRPERRPEQPGLRAAEVARGSGSGFTPAVPRPGIAAGSGARPPARRRELPRSPRRDREPGSVSATHRRRGIARNLRGGPPCGRRDRH
jgi:hypothetical protein